jgi:hypothetical protein
MEYLKILETPGGAAFVGRAMSALADGMNAVIILPDALRTQGFLDASTRRLRDTGGPTMAMADVSKTPSAESLAPFMAALPGEDRKKKRKPFPDYFRPGGSDYLKVTAFVGLECLPKAAQLACARELAAAAEASAEGPGGGGGKEGMRFAAFVRPDFPPVPETRGVRRFPWWGAASRADFDLLFEEAASRSGKSLSETDYWWLKAVAAGVGGDDPCLIGAVVDREPRDVESVRGILAAHPLSKRIPQEFELEGALLYPGISPGRSALPERPRDLALWSEGLLSPNRYSLYHPVLLASGGGLLERFLSRGQRDVLFPLVDQVHGAIIHSLEGELGTGLWDYYVRDASLKDAALREMGPLYKAMRECIRPESGGQRSFVEELAELASRWKLIRHLAAHSQVLDYRNWEKALDRYHRTSGRLFVGQHNGGRARAAY